MSRIKLDALRDHLLSLDSGSGDAATLAWASDRIRVLESLLKRADAVVVWDGEPRLGRDFQAEVEVALGISTAS